MERKDFKYSFTIRQSAINQLFPILLKELGQPFCYTSSYGNWGWEIANNWGWEMAKNNEYRIYFVDESTAIRMRLMI
jgi:hypothetical protein